MESQSIHFEKNKNIKALIYTLSILLALFLFFFLVSWSLPITPVMVDNGGVEVNLGNSDEGLGDIAPLLPGTPSNEAETNYNPSPSYAAEAETNPDLASNTDADATPINTSNNPQVKPKTNNNNTDVKNKPKQDVQNPNPAPPKAKAVYNGGSTKGTGGNNSDSYNNSKNQGVAGGNGDQGKPNGNPNSDSYNGNGGTGTGGISIVDGDLRNRKITSSARFEDEYKNGGKVYINVSVDANGNVTSATVRLQGSSPFTDLQSIAKQRALQLKFNKTDAAQSGTILIVFQNPKG